MKNDITTIRTALTAAKTVAYAHKQGGLHKLWPQLKEALEALDRIEQQVATTQMPMQLFPDTAAHQRAT